MHNLWKSCVSMVTKRGQTFPPSLWINDLVAKLCKTRLFLPPLIDNFKHTLSTQFNKISLLLNNHLSTVSTAYIIMSMKNSLLIKGAKK